MTNYQKARVKLMDTELNKLKSAAKYNTERTIKITTKNVQGEELPPELFLITRQKTKTRNAFAKNTSSDIKLNKDKKLNCLI